VGTAARREVLRSVVADVGLLRLQLVPISCGVDAIGIDRHDTIARAGDTRFGQQPLNGCLRAFVLALAKVMMADATLRIDEVQRGPIVVVEGTRQD